MTTNENDLAKARAIAPLFPPRLRAEGTKQIAAALADARADERQLVWQEALAVMAEDLHNKRLLLQQRGLTDK
jgi:hypothetical protein